MSATSSLTMKAAKATVAATMAFAIAIPLAPATSYAADAAAAATAAAEYQAETQAISGPDAHPQLVTTDIYNRFSNFQRVEGFENIYVCNYDASPTYHTRVIYSPDTLNYADIGTRQVGSYLPTGAQYPLLYAWSADYGDVAIFCECMFLVATVPIGSDAQGVGFIDTDTSLPQGDIVVTYRDSLGNDIAPGILDRESYVNVFIANASDDSAYKGMAVLKNLGWRSENNELTIRSEALFNTPVQIAQFKRNISLEGATLIDVFNITYEIDGSLAYGIDEFTMYIDTPERIKPMVGNKHLKVVRIDGDTGEYQAMPATIDGQYVCFKTKYSGDYAFIVEAEGEEGVSMHRLYNPNSGEHFYTSSDSERDHLVTLGWNSEGEGWSAPESGEPVYRLYNRNGGEHHYTKNAAERDMLVKVGWEYEGIGWYSDASQGVPIYREYNPNQHSNNHNYTSNKDEHCWLITLGWQDEGIAWYGI